MADIEKADIEKMEYWLNSHDTGISSKSIFHYMTLGLATGGAPSDPADLARCIRLLRIFPEWEPRIGEMSAVSKSWEKIAPYWQELVSCFYEECGDAIYVRGGNWSAPETYEKMQLVRFGTP